MTTDNFVETARAEAEALRDDIIRWDDTIATDGPCDGTWDSLAAHLAVLGWARPRPTAQEPTDAEVEAAARALDLAGAVYAFNGDRAAAEVDVARRPLDLGSARGEELQTRARAALSAARAARRDEENA